MNPTANPAAIEPEDYRRLVGFKLLLLAILGAAAFLNSLYGVFLFEDQRRILDNPDVHSLSMSTKAWLSPTRIADWSLALNYAISGTNPWSYHVVNVALHALAALALFGVVCRTLIRQQAHPRLQEAAPWLAFLAALLWMVHPLHTATVDYLARRGDLLAGLFYFVTLYCVIRGADSERGLIWYGLAVLACFLGMGSALTMATAPLVVLLYDRIYLTESWRDLWRRRGGLYMTLAVCWALFAASVAFVDYDHSVIGFRLPDAPPLAYALAQPGVVMHELGLVFWPLGTSYRYFTWPLEQQADAYVVPFVVVGALLLATVWTLLRRPKIGYLGAWFFLTLAPSSSLIPHTEIADDSRMYLPLAAVAVLAVLAGFALIGWLRERVPWAAYAAAVLALLAVSALGYTTFCRNATYENELTLLEDTVARRPGDVGAQLLLAVKYRGIGEPMRIGEGAGAPNAYLDRAAAALQVILKSPDAQRDVGFRDSVRNYLAEILFSNNQWDELVKLISEVPGDAPQAAKELNDVGFNLWLDPRPANAANAAKFFAEAARIQPEAPKYHFNLALALLDKGDKDEAEAERKKGLELDPDWPKTAQEQAWAKATDADPSKRNPLQAIFLARQACQSDGQRPECLDALAAAYAAAGRFKEAQVKAEQARRLADAQNNAVLSREIQLRLALYKKQQPFVQSQAAP